MINDLCELMASIVSLTIDAIDVLVMLTRPGISDGKGEGKDDPDLNNGD